MHTRHFIIGTAGHIDHGKSSLVKALTGTDPDRLPEEKARGMTIDLGFAHLQIDDPAQSGTRYDIGLIDVPGHADFVKNMVAGVGGIDAALFVVAADDGWMPQTEEHLQILTYLGVRHAVVALTKSDLVSDLEFSVEMLRENLKGTVFENAGIIPTAATKGEGIAELKAALAELLARMPPSPDIGKPRLPVDRTFSPLGIGTVVTGTLAGGCFARGQEVVIQPGGIKSHIRNVQSHNKDQESVVPATRVALNLADVPIATKLQKRGVSRGDVVTLESLGAGVDTLDVLLEKSGREVPGHLSGSRPLRNGQKVNCHYGGAAVEARVYLLGAKALSPGEKILAELRFAEPVFAFAGDRFVLRDLSKQATLAGGIVLDPDARRAHFRKPRQKIFLETRAAQPASASAFLTSLLLRDGAASRSQLLVKSHFAAPEIDAALSRLVAENLAVVDGGWVIDGIWWRKQLEDAVSSLKAFHKANPQLPGQDFLEFINTWTGKFSDKKIADLFAHHLTAVGLIRTGKSIRWSGHQPSLPAQLQQAGAKVRAALARNPIEPPNPAELAPTPIEKQALKFLLDTGEAIQLDEKAILSTEAFEKIKAQAIGHLRTAKKATVSDLRQLLGTTRRILVPFLEKLDREGTTRREGDFRTLKNP